MVLSGDVIYRKSLNVAVRGQEKTRAKMAEKFPNLFRDDRDGEELSARGGSPERSSPEGGIRSGEEKGVNGYGVFAALNGNRGNGMKLTSSDEGGEALRYFRTTHTACCWSPRPKNSIPQPFPSCR